jgi:murein DD-endopeptidase MepM/ murein hydrolase activator NlpD
VSGLRKYKKMENALFARVSARIAAAFASFKALLSRVKTTGRQKLTIMLIPHTEKKILNIQLSFFALGALLVVVVAALFAFIFSAARFSDTANRLQASSSDLASTQGKLEDIRDQTSRLVIAAKRFESALTGTLGRIGTKPAAPDSPAQSGDLASFFESDLSGEGSTREIGDLQKVTSFLEQKVDPLKQLGSLLQNESAILTEIPNIWPVKGASHISMYYGQNENPFTGQWYVHKGVDISTYRSGDPVIATADGRVVAIGFDPSLGNYIIIQHSHGFITRYGHLMAFRVAKGQKVQQGQVIGLLGNTGMTTGPHLHYEVHLGTSVVDPLKFLNIRAAATATE